MGVHVWVCIVCWVYMCGCTCVGVHVWVYMCGCTCVGVHACTSVCVFMYVQCVFGKCRVTCTYGETAQVLNAITLIAPPRDVVVLH